MEKITEKLQSLGLSAKESEVYVEGISSGPVSVQQLALRTKIKRPTVYHTVDLLEKKGLAITRNTYEGKRVVMTDPSELRGLIQLQKKEIQGKEVMIEGLIPTLKGMVSGKKKDRMDVRQFDDIEGIKVALDEALYCRKREWSIIAPRTNFLDDFDQEYKDYYIKTRKQRKINNRTLWEQREEGESETRDDFAWRNPRILPQEMSGAFDQIMILYDDKVLYLSSYKNKTALIVTSPEHHVFMKALFEGLWVHAQPMTQHDKSQKEEK